MSNRGDKMQEAVAATSSVPEKIPSDQHALFREVLQSFEEAGKQYAVAGTFALQKHTGIFRSTKDLDIFLSPDAARAALKGLKDAGFRCEVCDPIWLAKVHRDGYFVDLITGMSNGVITVDQSWIDRANPASVLGVSTRVLGAEELVASKLFVTRRERFDGADISHIIYATHGKLAWARILELAGEHWELVLWNLILFRYVYPAHSKLVPQSVWRDLLTRFSELVRNSREGGEEFRGSLIDDAMFAIDVEEWGLENLLLEYQQRRMKIA
jgi:hypothetical protein